MWCGRLDHQFNVRALSHCTSLFLPLAPSKPMRNFGRHEKTLKSACFAFFAFFDRNSNATHIAFARSKNALLDPEAKLACTQGRSHEQSKSAFLLCAKPISIAIEFLSTKYKKCKKCTFLCFSSLLAKRMPHNTRRSINAQASPGKPLDSAPWPWIPKLNWLAPKGETTKNPKVHFCFARKRYA